MVIIQILRDHSIALLRICAVLSRGVAGFLAGTSWAHAQARIGPCLPEMNVQNALQLSLQRLVARRHGPFGGPLKLAIKPRYAPWAPGPRSASSRP